MNKIPRSFKYFFLGDEDQIKVANFLFDQDRIEFVSVSINAWVDNFQHEVLQTPRVVESPKKNTKSPPTHIRKPSDYVPPKLTEKSKIISESDQLLLVPFLPRRYASSDWSLLYSTDKHGISINTFYSKVKEKGPTILLIEDSNHYVFGAFVSESWKSDYQGYYGTGETFLFTLRPKLSVYKWTQQDNYFILSSMQSLSIGGGGTYGLWIDNEFHEGSSSECTTFLNSCLSSTQIFKCIYVEIWGF